MAHQYINRIINLGSSSDGNSFYIELQPENEKQFNLLIECGFDYNTLLKKFIQNKIDVTDIDAVVVSHLHKDHSMSVKHFVDRGYEVYAPQSVYDLYHIKGNVLSSYNPMILSDSINIIPLPMEHYDVNQKVENYGFIIHIKNKYHILFVIDTKYIPQDLSNYQFDMIFIESNYIEDSIKHALYDAEKKQDKGKIKRYERLYNSHFSLENVARTFDGSINKNARPLDLSKTTNIFLMHLSSNRQTNDRYYELFLKNFIDATRDITNAKPNIMVKAMKKDGGF